MRGLVYHGCAFNVADLLHGGFLVLFGKGVDVVEDVGWFLDAEGGSKRCGLDTLAFGWVAVVRGMSVPHFGKHVVLWFAWRRRYVSRALYVVVGP